MPQTVEGLSGSCVIIPCTFSLPSGWDQHLDDSCKAIWKRGSWSRTQVFDSSLTGASASLNILQGNLTGVLHKKDCTTIFNNLPSNHYDNYYFRLQCENDLKFNFQTSVIITAQEGSSVTLTCNTNANPVVDIYTWYKVDGDEVTAIGSRKKLSTTVSEVDSQFYCKVISPKDTTVVVDPDGPILEGTSVTLFCRSRANPPVTNYTWHKDNEEDQESGSILVINSVDPSHSGDYHCATRNELGEEVSAAIQLDIQFAPDILPSSRCIKILSQIRCYCDSQGNPLPSLVWELAGEPVNHSADIPIREVPQGSVGMRSCITLYHMDGDMPSLVCLSINSLGSDRFAFNVSATNLEKGGVAGKDPVHYVKLDFAELQAKSDSKLEEGEIGGPASKMTEYAQICLHSGGSNGGDAKEEVTVTDTHLGPEKDTNGLMGQVSEKAVV
ncbi:Myelin-associated glycoprotein [Nibea albiflora]|uniref:Myelin-associated glycoprotein n=1 Tax=Nibea albiflora TaxID=240163 RepID=A0ACB7F6F0_NIBAL|nr:Myelin-associated glycoprotein [Nibea albiflora]